MWETVTWPHVSCYFIAISKPEISGRTLIEFPNGAVMGTRQICVAAETRVSENRRHFLFRCVSLHYLSGDPTGALST